MGPKLHDAVSTPFEYAAVITTMLKHSFDDWLMTHLWACCCSVSAKVPCKACTWRCSSLFSCSNVLSELSKAPFSDDTRIATSSMRIFSRSTLASLKQNELTSILRSHVHAHVHAHAHAQWLNSSPVRDLCHYFYGLRFFLAFYIFLCLFCIYPVFCCSIIVFFAVVACFIIVDYFVMRLCTFYGMGAI